jgi:ADP-ribose pyrophosphatase
LENAACRELLEETGYFAAAEDIELITPSLLGVAAIISDAAPFVKIRVNMDRPENENPQPSREVDENIRVVILKHDDLLEEIGRLTAAESIQVDGRVYNYAMGLRFAALNPPRT